MSQAQLEEDVDQDEFDKEFDAAFDDDESEGAEEQGAVDDAAAGEGSNAARLPQGQDPSAVQFMSMATDM